MVVAPLHVECAAEDAEARHSAYVTSIALYPTVHDTAAACLRLQHNKLKLETSFGLQAEQHTARVDVQALLNLVV